MPKTELACGTCYDLHDFGGSRKGIENGGQKASKSDPKIDLLSLWGAIFEILGGFWRGLIFDGFLSGKNSAKIDAERRPRTPRDTKFPILDGLFSAAGGGGDKPPTSGQTSGGVV